MPTTRTLAFVAAFAAASTALSIDPNKPILARNATLGANTIVFEFGTDLWSMPREGGRARRLTVGPGIESNPFISPDGNWVAFAGEYDGNQDVFVVPIEGGQPRRLTFHPGSDVPSGWTPNGNAVLFGSGMDHPNGQTRLYTVPATGGWPTALPLPRGNHGAFSPDGTRIAYVPHDQWQPEWKFHKGGQNSPVWIARLSDSKIEKVPREASNDRNPMWIGDTVYFVSSRSGRSGLYAYETGSKRVRQVAPPGELGIKYASAGPGGILIERLGSLYLYDLSSKTEKKLNIEIADDLLELRPTFKPVGDMIMNADLSPSGVRAVFEARGDVFTVPVDKGDARNLTQTPGIAERSPIWSPDGKKIAYLSDADGNYKLHIADQMGGGTPEVISLTDKATWIRTIEWAPDSKKILFIDQGLHIGYVDVDTKRVTRFDREPFYWFGDALAPDWSPDSKWIVYTKRLNNNLRGVFAYSLESGKFHQLTDGLSDASSAVFDRGGRYIYFLASTDIAQSISVGGMSTMGQQFTFSPYMIVLRSTDPTPFTPESDEEPGATAKPPIPGGGMPLPGGGGQPGQGGQGNPGGQGGQGGPGGAPGQGTPAPSGPETRIDVDGISQRILALPMPAAQYSEMVPATPNSVFILRSGTGGGFGLTALKFSLQSRQASTFASGIFGMTTTAKGDKALLMGLGGNQIVSTMQPPQPGQGTVNTAGMTARVDPPAEWRQMFREVWRNMRDFLYAPNMHGLDYNKVVARFEPYLDNLASRQDYNYLMQDMLNEVTVGHTFSGGGEVPSADFVPGGLLGADYSLENGRYRFKRVYNGENWNPGLRAPLTQPGAVVKEGEYLIAVNGANLTDKENIYERFENTANKQVSITVGPNPDGSVSRTIVVVPVGNEVPLRQRAWIEDNRRKVDQMTGGKVSYIYVPNTGGGGYQSFNRYFTAQLDKPAVLIDERYNSGGALSDYIVQILSRRVLAMANQRDHQDFSIPMFANEGPKAMIVNEMAGSGGDALPWFFRVMKLGPIFGTRTWGGLVAAGGGVPLMGGGFATAPQVAIYGLKGEWEVENHGVAPDVQIEEDPFLWRQGRDMQLERAVEHLMEQLKKNPPKPYKRPTYPDYHKGTSIGGQ